MRAAGCKNLSKSPKGDFRQSEILPEPPVPGEFFCQQNKKRAAAAAAALFFGIYRTYSMTTRRFGSTPVEWVVMLSMSWSAAWITWRS